ncbi:MAG TPA: putative sulfate exporter family transporter [Chloroflexota bacterium]|nr:putative sulfate exporter family transporter [Chloroflexota bacterium]
MSAVESRAAARPWWGGSPAWLPGMTLAAVLAVLALAVAELETRAFGQPLIEGLVVALLLGVLVRNVLPSSQGAACNPGTSLASKQVLEAGVALLGASVSFPALLSAGPALLGLVLGGVGLGIGASFLLGRGFGLPTKLAVLVAVGSSICGNSAIAAVAPVIRAEKRDVASAIGLTAAIGVAMVLALPWLIEPASLSHYQYGVLAGMSVYAVPQVMAAAFPVSQLSGEVATLVKLTRVLLLGPVVVVMGLLFRGGEARKSVSAYLPWFVLLFLLLATIRSAGWLPDAVSVPAREVSRLLTVLAMAGLGFGVELAAVRSVGPRVGAAVLASLAVLVAFSLVALRLLGIDG